MSSTSSRSFQPGFLADDNRPMFLMILGNNCGHCRNFKHNELEKIIDRYRSVKPSPTDPTQQIEKFDLDGLSAMLDKQIGRGGMTPTDIKWLLQSLSRHGLDSNTHLNKFFDKVVSSPTQTTNNNPFAHSTMSELIYGLQRDGRVRIRSLVVDNIRQFDLGSDYHPQLKSLVHWFPTFILIAPPSWDRSGHTQPIQARVLGQKYKSDGSPDDARSGVALNTQVIMTEFNREFADQAKQSNDTSSRPPSASGNQPSVRSSTTTQPLTTTQSLTTTQPLTTTRSTTPAARTPTSRLRFGLPAYMSPTSSELSTDRYSSRISFEPLTADLAENSIYPYSIGT